MSKGLSNKQEIFFVSYTLKKTVCYIYIDANIQNILLRLLLNFNYSVVFKMVCQRSKLQSHGLTLTVDIITTKNSLICCTSILSTTSIELHLVHNWLLLESTQLVYLSATDLGEVLSVLRRSRTIVKICTCDVHLFS